MSATLQKHWRPKGHDESSLLFVVHVLHLILFVEEYMWGVTWGSVIDQCANWEATFFFSFLRPVLKSSVS